MSEQNKALVRRVFEEVENRGNFAVADELIASDYIGHSPLEEVHGLEGFKQFFVMLREAFPDFQCLVESQIAEGDRVVTRWTARGTHKGEFQGIPPTGTRITTTGIDIVRIANGKIVEGWTNADVLGLLVQLGAVPAPGPTG
jgi:steroid delta-isomerase-like uncharacterized protein